MLAEPLLTPRKESSGLLARLESLSSPPTIRVRDPNRSSTGTENFFDVALIFVLSAVFHLPVSLGGLAELSLAFALLWNGWVGIAFYNTRFDTDDLLSRTLACLDMLAIVGMSASVPAENHSVLMLSYAGMRVTLVVRYIRAFVALPAGRPLTGRFALCFGAGVGCWAAAIVTTVAPLRHALVVCGLAFDFGTPFALLRWMLPVHSRHLPERFGGLVALNFTGALMCLVSSMPAPLPPAGSHASASTDAASEARDERAVAGAVVVFAPALLAYLRLAALGILLAFGNINLAARLRAPPMDAFAESMRAKLVCYAYLYLHMPLTLTITVMSTALGNLARHEHTDHDAAFVLPMASGLTFAQLGEHTASPQTRIGAGLQPRAFAAGWACALPPYRAMPWAPPPQSF
jgi:low temperature requirement protein LtrA